MALDTRWKNPQGKDPEQLWRWAQDVIVELRKGDYLPSTPSADDIAFDNTASGLTADNVQDAIDEVEGRVDTLEALPDAGLVLLTSNTVSGQANLDIPLTSYTAYRALKLMLHNFIPVNDDVELWLRFSTDGGANFATTNYRHAVFMPDSSGANQVNNSGSAGQIVIAGGTAGTGAVSNVTAEGGATIEITIHQQTVAHRTQASFKGVFALAADRVASIIGAGEQTTAQDTDAVRFRFETGNIASGSWALYGYA